MDKIRPQMSKTAAGIKAYYQYIISAALTILLILIVYGRDLAILLNEAMQSEASTYAILVPFFFGIILYLKRNVVKASLALEKYQQKTKTRYIDELVGGILCLVAFLMYWYGSYTFYPLEYHILSLPIFIMGTALILFNLKTLIVLILPILFLLFLVPIPTEFLYAAGSSLANFDTQISYALLKALNIPVVLNTSYGSPALELTSSAGNPANFSIGLPCSGIYSLLAFAMFAVFLTFIISAPLFKKGLTFLLGFFVFGIINIFRISSIITVAYWAGEDIAMLIYHTIAGILFIAIGMLLVLFISEKLWKIQILPTPPIQPSCSKCETSMKNLENFCANCGKFLNPTKTKISQKFWMKTFLLLLACSIVVFSINAPTFAVAQGPLGVAANANWQTTTNIFPPIANYNLGFLYRDTQYEKIAQQDASLLYAYMNKTRQTIYIDVGVSSSISNLHNWEVCLISWQTTQGRYPLVTVLDSKDIQLLQGVPIVARYLVFTRPDNLTQITLYWYEQAPFNTGVTVQQKYVRLSLLILTYNATDYQRWEKELLPFAQTVAEYWEPLKNQSIISLGVPAQQALLGFSIVAVAFIKTAQYSNERRKKTNNQHIFNNFASEEDRITLRTIQELTTTRKGHLEMKDIAEALKKKTKKGTKSGKLFTTLTHLEEYGFIKRDIISTQNKPKLVWKIL